MQPSLQRSAGEPPVILTSVVLGLEQACACMLKPRVCRHMCAKPASAREKGRVVTLKELDVCQNGEARGHKGESVLHECRCCPPQGWGIVWAMISLILMGGGILAGIAAFK